MMTDVTITIEGLKATTLPTLFQNASEIGRYGPQNAVNPASLNQLSDLMESGSVSKLSKLIGDIVDRLSEADPKVISQPPTWWEKLLGKNVEKHVQYQVARRGLEALIEEAEKVSVSVTETLLHLDQLLSTHHEEATALRLYIDAGNEYLNENPTAGLGEPGEMVFDKPRERFARKLANLATLLQSHEMSLLQMKLTKAQALDMQDRFNETISVLVPVWRQHTLALITNGKMSPAMVAEATKAHSALMKSLADSLDGLE